MNQLPLFEGHRPDTTLVKLTGTFEPSEILQQAHGLDDEVVLMVRGTVSKVSHEEQRTKDAELVARVHTIKVDELVVVDEGVQAFTEARSRALANAGISELPGVGA